jgi:uncharacterized membrane protein HdeD (DUF308 family)
MLAGIITFLWPGITFMALVFLFAAYALVDGVVNLAGAIHAIAAHERWGALLFEGIAGIAAAVITFFSPGITALALVLVIAVWAILTGIAEIAAAARLRRLIPGEWLLAVSGVLSIVFGVLVLAVPFAGALVISLWFGAYALIFGVALVSLGLRLRTWDKTLFSRGAVPAPAH